jgi:uncharacterized membrane protein
LSIEEKNSPDDTKRGTTSGKIPYRIYLGLAIAGILDAVYHTYSELTQVFRYCNINVHVSCGLVFQTGYTTIVIGHTAIPFWLLGVVWFPLMVVAGLVLWNRSKMLLIPILLIGNMFTIYLWYLDVIIYEKVQAICPVCVSLYCINYAMTGIVIASVYSNLKKSS